MNEFKDTISWDYIYHNPGNLGVCLLQTFLNKLLRRQCSRIFLLQLYFGTYILMRFWKSVCRHFEIFNDVYRQKRKREDFVKMGKYWVEFVLRP